MMTRKQFIAAFPVLGTALPIMAQQRVAPELRLVDLSGNVHRIGALRGKVVLLEFMLTTCPHCQNTARLISVLQRELGPNGLQTFSVAFNDDAAIEAPKFARVHNITHPVAVLPRHEVYAFAQLSMVVRHTVPIIVVVDRQGNVRDQFEGDSPFFQSEEQNLRALLAERLKENAKPKGISPQRRKESASSASRNGAASLRGFRR